MCIYIQIYICIALHRAMCVCVHACDLQYRQQRERVLVPDLVKQGRE